MVILFFYPFLMSLPLPSTARRGRQKWRVVTGDKAEAPAFLQALMMSTCPLSF